MNASSTADRSSSDRPGLETGRKVPLRVWILQEWGLLLLAAVLAVILWEVTSTRVIRELRITEVRVELVVLDQDQERIGAILNKPDTVVTLEMTCSERERYAVLAALTETGGGTPVLKLQISPQLDEGTPARPIGTRDVWLWPVPNAAEIELRVEVLPGGTVYRIEGMQQVHIAKPNTLPDAAGLKALGYEILITDPESDPPVDIRLDHAFMEFLAPRAIFSRVEGGLSMQPDPIDLNALIAGEAPPLGKPQTFKLTFNQWRRAEPYRSRLELKNVTATLALYRPAMPKFTNRLEVLLHAGFEWQASAQPDITPGQPQRFTGTLSGPKWILDEIMKDPAGWMWQMWIAEPASGWPVSTMTDTEEWIKNVPARIEWVPLRPAWKNKGVRFVPKENSGEDGFYVKIRRRQP